MNSIQYRKTIYIFCSQNKRIATFRVSIVSCATSIEHIIASFIAGYINDSHLLVNFFGRRYFSINSGLVHIFSANQKTTVNEKQKAFFIPGKSACRFELFL